uniref:Uncharacterized protein TCIL3000_11_8970 n=1 Tax=Trypanosoma congolense (strain IL3000) TaxID=1068625 RepID=G0V1B9_TRYCI|nr:unnamed protein product [Trypanosoma congolense IL3000]
MMYRENDLQRGHAANERNKDHGSTTDPRNQSQHAQYNAGGYAECDISDGSADGNNRHTQRGETQRSGTHAPPGAGQPSQDPQVGYGGYAMDNVATPPPPGGRHSEAVVSPKNMQTVFLGVCVLNIFFAILGTALSQLDVIGGACYTFWGYKRNCDSVSYTIRTQLLTCTPTRTRLQVGAAFSIISIFLVAGILCFYIREAVIKYMTRSTGSLPQAQQYGSVQGRGAPLKEIILARKKWIIVGLAALVILCEVISWAMTVSIYISRFCEGAAQPRDNAYGPGFALLIVGTLLLLLALPGFIIMT